MRVSGVAPTRECENRNVAEKVSSSSFDWRIYADATCAGLSALIPLPLLDIAFEAGFRRRIPQTISRVRSRPVDASVQRRLARGMNPLLSVSGCFMVPVAVGRYVARRLWRKIVYVFAVADAVSSLTDHWHLAYLVDHMVRAGHLDAGCDLERAVRAARRALREADPSPLTGIARQIVANTGQVLRLLVRARRLGASQVTKTIGDMVAWQWKPAEASLRCTADLYNELYRSGSQP